MPINKYSADDSSSELNWEGHDHENSLERLLSAEELPHVLRDLTAECKRLHGVDWAISLTMALGAIATSTGKSVVARNDPYRTRPNVFFLILAESGVAKSCVAKSIFKPIYSYDQERIKKHSTEVLPQLKAEQEILEKRKKKLLSSIQSDNRASIINIEKEIQEINSKRPGPRLVVEDSTVQSLAMRLRENDETLSCISLDAGDVADNLLGRYHPSGQTEDALFLKAFSGDNYIQDRVTRGPVVLESPCLNIIWTCTPDLEEKFFENERLIRGGFLPRMLIALSNCRAIHEEETIRTPNESVWDRWHQFLRSNLANYFGTSKTTTELYFTSEALQVLKKFNNTGVDEGRIFPAVRSFKARKREHAIKISTLLHLASCFKKELSYEIQAETAVVACKLVDFYQQSPCRAMSLRQQMSDTKTMRRIKDIAEGDTEVSMRVLKRSGFLESDIEALVSRNQDALLIRTKTPENPSKGGRPSRVLIFKPAPPTEGYSAQENSQL